LRRSVALTEIAPTVTEERVTEAPVTETPMPGKPMAEVLTLNPMNTTVEMGTATEVSPGPTTPPPVVEAPTPPVVELGVRRNGRRGKKDAEIDEA
jgi:hypothetical protein